MKNDKVISQAHKASFNLAAQHLKYVNSAFFYQLILHHRKISRIEVWICRLYPESAVKNSRIMAFLDLKISRWANRCCHMPHSGPGSIPERLLG
jgi:hypothetical protein